MNDACSKDSILSESLTDSVGGVQVEDDGTTAGSGEE